MAREMNTRLRSAEEGADEPIQIDLTGHTPSEGISGHLEEGVYEFTCRSAKLIKSKKGDPLLKLAWVSSGPEEYKGIKVMDWRKIPVGDPDDEDVQKVKRMFDSMVASILDSMGKYEQGRTSFSKKPSWFINKKSYIQVQDDNTPTGNLISTANFYVMREEFEGVNGPFHRGSSENIRVNSRGNTESKSNGTEAGASAARELLNGAADTEEAVEGNTVDF